MNRIKICFFGFVILQSFLLNAKDYKGAEYRTKESFLYGRFEVKYKSSAGSGQTSTFFLYNDDYPNTAWNEIDIEILGRYTDDIQFNPITPGRINHERHQYVDFNPALDFHTYNIEWTPQYVAWFVDGVEVSRQTGEHIEALNISQKIMMNIWNPVYDNWVGEWNDKLLPFFAYYDYVSYASYTPGSGNIGTDNNFSFQWKDDFDSWDQNKWQKATHTFDGNACDFIHENVIFRKGNMVLCLTDDSNLGYQDKVAPSILWARADENIITVKFSEELEKTSAENPANYIVSGVSIDQIKCLDDESIVTLSVTGMDLSHSYNVVALNVVDKSLTPNKLIGQSVKIIMPDPLNFPIKINIGGDAYNDYLPDQEWEANVEYGYSDGSSSFVPASQQIVSNDDEEVYHTDRNGLVIYRIRVPNNHYKVTLMMAETYFVESSQRVFDVFVESTQCAENIDVYKNVGKNKAYDFVIPDIEVKDRILDIHFCAETDRTSLRGLVVESLDTGIGENTNNIPVLFSLSQNYPNPFNSSTLIHYHIPEQSFVNLSIYDVLGRKIENLVNNTLQPGAYQSNWSGDSASGLYFYKLDAVSNNKKYSQTKNMIFIK